MAYADNVLSAHEIFNESSNIKIILPKDNTFSLLNLIMIKFFLYSSYIHLQTEYMKSLEYTIYLCKKTQCIISVYL